jgi:tRNA-splicing ligase RtcB (3'-phosphate/5'-hydroxy nucleic acid ligase)
MFEIKGKYTTASVHINNIDETTMEQIIKMTNNSYFTNPIHIMPDTHAGKGSVIGFTMRLTGLSIIPNIVSVDVNCGMVAIKLDNLTDKQNKKFNAKNEKYMKKLDERIRELIPMGFNIHDTNDLDTEDILKNIAKDSQEEAIKFAHKFYNEFGIKIIDKMPDYTSEEYFKNTIKKIGISEKRLFGGIGTLGGGNHFIEIGKDENGDIWMTIHTGSRNFGNLIAKYWQSIAIEEAMRINGSIDNEVKALIEELKAKNQFDKIQKEVAKLRSKYKNMKVRDAELSVLTGDNAAGYFFDMIYAGKYAEYNRKTICDLIMNEFEWDAGIVVKSNHNFIDFNDMIIRKGAIASYEDELMVIPFNMKDGLLIVEGKSNADWNYSCAHGAGRILSRSEAKRTLIQKEAEDSMKMANIYTKGVPIDEAPKAYKDAKIIEIALKDTISVVYRVKPILNIKDLSVRKKWKIKV